MTLPIFSSFASGSRAGNGSSNANAEGNEEGGAAAAVAESSATSSRRRRSRRRSGLRDIFAIPTHRPTTAATDGYGSDDAVMDAPRVGRPQPGPSVPTGADKPLPPQPRTSSIQRAISLQNKAPPPYTKRRAPGDAEVERRRAAGERFPRWRGWLEKRALERHGSDAGEDVRRKKSWGAWVNDADAVDDEGPEGDDQNEDDGLEAAAGLSSSQPPIPPPLHVHQLGSRFLPHLMSPPLCAVYLTIPPPALPRRLPPRQLLLVGTAEGLFAIEHGKPRRRGGSDERGWNQDVRCTQIWSGLAVYQLAILHDTAEPPPTGGPSTTTMATSISLPSLWGSRSATASSSPSPGVMLGLCSSTPSTMSPRSRFSMLGSNASNTAVDSASTTSHGPTPSVVEEGPSPPASFHFGVGGGSVNRSNGGTANGIVKLWTLDAVIRVVSYVLDDPQATHLDLSTPTATERSGASRLSRHFRNAWQSISEMAALSNERPRVFERRAESDSYGMAESRAAPSQRQRPRSTQFDGTETAWQPASASTIPAGEQQGDGQGNAADELDEHGEALKLAQAATSIDGLASGQDSRRQSNVSAAAVDEERRRGGAASPLPPSSSSASTSTSRGSAAGGCSFFAVHEAAAGTKGAGTWFLALATARGIRLYEATPRRRSGAGGSSDQARSWVFLKEFYTPLPPKAMAFASTATAAGGAATAAAVATDTSAASSDGRDSPSSSAVLVHTGGKAILSLDDEPLSHAKKASRPRSSLWSSSSSTLSGLRGSSGVLRPQHGGGAAGPRSWSGADLSLFVSFGRRAVVIRLSDSNVREVDVAGGGATAERPLSPASETPVGPSSSSEHTIKHSTQHHRRSSSLEMLGAFDRQAAAKATLARKQQQRWVGLEVVQCQIAVRERVRDEDEEDGAAAAAAARSAASTPGLPSSAAMSPSSSATARPAFTTANSMPTLLLSGMPSSNYQPQVEDDSSDEEEEDAAEDDSFNVTAFRGIELHDGPTPRRKPQRPTMPRDPSSSSNPTASGPSIPLLASLTLLTRGSSTHVLPYPLPADLVHPAALDALQWSDVPDSVTGWSRVLGMQRASSSGPLSTSALAAKRRKAQKAASSAPTVSLQISLTALASFPHRTEMRRVTLWLDVPVPAVLSRSNVELEIVAAPEEAAVGPVLDAAVRPSLVARSSSAVVEHAYPTGIVVPCPQAGGVAPRALFHDGGQRRGGGGHGQRGEGEAVAATSSLLSSSTLTAPARLAPEAAVGDGGAWCAVQKGGSDYRLCYVGAEV